MVVMKLIGLVTGEPTDLDGGFLLTYTPDGHDGRGFAEVTRNVALAKRYATGREAMEDWARVSATHPVRVDGKPNRPLSAFTVEVNPLE
jgi:hypothetical protein